MITIITDQKTGEPDILTPVQNQILYVKDLDNKPIIEVHPTTGPWTTESLIETAESLYHLGFTNNGANAYLGNQYVGSTEI